MIQTCRLNDFYTKKKTPEWLELKVEVKKVTFLVVLTDIPLKYRYFLGFPLSTGTF
jgi:hypothetical protein